MQLVCVCVGTLHSAPPLSDEMMWAAFWPGRCVDNAYETNFEVGVNGTQPNMCVSLAIYRLFNYNRSLCNGIVIFEWEQMGNSIENDERVFFC